MTIESCDSSDSVVMSSGCVLCVVMLGLKCRVSRYSGVSFETRYNVQRCYVYPVREWMINRPEHLELWTR